MLLNMFTSPDESHFTNAENRSLMIVLFFQKLNKITLSVTPSASQECLSHVALLDLEFWCKRLQIRSLQTNDLLITCHFTHCCPSPAHRSCSANMWLCGAAVTWIKYLATLGERSQDVFYGLMTLDHSAARHRPRGACTGMGRAGLQGLEPARGVAGLGTVPVGAVWTLVAPNDSLSHCRHGCLEIGWVKSCLLNKAQSLKLWASFHVVLQSSNTRQFP